MNIDVLNIFLVHTFIFAVYIAYLLCFFSYLYIFLYITP